MIRPNSFHTRATRYVYDLVTSAALILALGSLSACDLIPEVIGDGVYSDASLDPEDDLSELEQSAVMEDSGVLPWETFFGSPSHPPSGKPAQPVPQPDTGPTDLFGRIAPEQAFPGRKGEEVSITFETESGSHEVTVEVIDGQAILEGDIRLGHIDDLKAEPSTRSAAIALRSARWPGGVVPYDTSGISGTTLAEVTIAIADWNADTGIQLVPRTSQSDYIVFVSEDGCSSFVGMQGGPQEVDLHANCSAGNARHEIGHAVGLLHEHTRSDRDDHVTIDFTATDNPSAYESWVDAGRPGVDLGPYDLNSLMHYGSNFFDIDSAVPVMLTIDGDEIAAQRNELTPGDLWGVDRIYFNTWQVSWSGTSVWETLNYSGIQQHDLLFGDLNGDGSDDVFFANGSSWQVSWSGTSAWQTINTSGYRKLQLGDLNGDGEDDVFLATGRAWYVSWSGTSSWSRINNSRFTDVELADLNGDGADDVFLAHGIGWYVSWNGTSAWNLLNVSAFSDVELGDLNGDGTDDVFVATGSRWHVSWNGTGPWDTLNTSSFQNVRLADFDGDGRDDVFHADGGRWRVSWSGTSVWETINSSGYSDVAIADFDGDGEADVMVQMAPYGI